MPVRSPFLDLARQGRRLTPVWLVIVLALAIWFLSIVVRGVFAEAFAPDAGQSTALGSALAFAPAVVVAYGLRVLLAWLWVRQYEGRGIATLGLHREHAVIRLLTGFAAGAALFGVVVAVLAATGSLRLVDGPPTSQGTAALGGVLVVVVAWLVQAGGEEVLFRGFLLQGIGSRSLWLGIAVQAVLFAVAHQQALGSPVALLNLVLFAVLAALWALRQGSLWGVIGFHAAWNWVQGNVAGIAVSGNEAPGGALVRLVPDGPAALSGGAFGAEGSLVVTAVLLTATAAAGWSLRRVTVRA